MGDDYGLRSFDPSEFTSQRFVWGAGMTLADYRPAVKILSDSGPEAVIPKRIAGALRQRMNDHYLDALGYGLGKGGTSQITTVNSAAEGSLTLETLNDMMTKVQDQLRLPTLEEVRERVRQKELRRMQEDLEDMPDFGVF